MARRARGGDLNRPHLRLLTAAAGEDEPALRSRARALSAGRPHRFHSRAYCFPYALVGWHDRRVGVDVERVVACDERFGRSICTPEEEARGPWPRPDADVISLWAGKEALAKALGDALAYDPRRLESPQGWPAGARGSWRARRLEVAPGHCAWVCWQVCAG